MQMNNCTKEYNNAQKGAYKKDPNLNRCIEDCIEEALAIQLSLSALHLSGLEGDEDGNNEEDESANSNYDDAFEMELDRIENSSSYKALSQKIQIRMKSEQKLMSMKPKKSHSSATTTSFSLFDMLSSSAILSPPMNIRDIFDLDCRNNNENDQTSTTGTRTILLDKCYDANIQDLILGFNTTNTEVLQLASLLYNNLVEEFNNSDNDNNNLRVSVTSNKTFLDLHVQWVEECVNDEECLSFSFMLLRNVILSLQHVQKMKHVQIMSTMEYMMKALHFQMKQFNDGMMFQTSWIEIMYLLIQICFGRTATKNNHDHNDDNSNRIALHVAWAYYDENAIIFSQCIACIASPLHFRSLLIQTNLYHRLLDILLNGYSLPEESSFDLQEDWKSKVAIHTLHMMKHIILNLSCQTFPYQEIINETSTSLTGGSIENRLEIKDLGENFVWIEEMMTENKFGGQFIDSSSPSSSKSLLTEYHIWYLLQPFYSVLDLGISSSKAFISFDSSACSIIPNICEDVIIHVILSGCSKNYGLVLNVLSTFQTLIKRISNSAFNSCTEEEGQCPEYSVLEDKSTKNTIRLGRSKIPSSVISIFRIYRRLFMKLPMKEYSNHCTFWKEQLTSLLECLHNILSISISHHQNNILDIDSSSLSDMISILYPIFQIDMQWNFLISSPTATNTGYSGINSRSRDKVVYILKMHQKVMFLPSSTCGKSKTMQEGTNAIINSLFASTVKGIDLLSEVESGVITEVTIDAMDMYFADCNSTISFEEISIDVYELLKVISSHHQDGFITLLTSKEIPRIRKWFQMLTQQSSEALSMTEQEETVIFGIIALIFASNQFAWALQESELEEANLFLIDIILSLKVTKQSYLKSKIIESMTVLFSNEDAMDVILEDVKRKHEIASSVNVAMKHLTHGNLVIPSTWNSIIRRLQNEDTIPQA